MVNGSGGETYERSASDVFLIQEEIARAIASSLRITLAPRVSRGASRRRLTTPICVRGSSSILRVAVPHHATIGGAAIALLEQAVADDSAFARGWAQLGRSYVRLAEYVSAPTVLPKAKQSILRAVQLDPTNAEVTLSFAGILLNYDWNWVDPNASTSGRFRSTPKSAAAHREYSALLGALRRHDEALRETSLANTLEWQQAADTTGLRANHAQVDCHTLAMAGRAAEARRAFEEAMRLRPPTLGSMRSRVSG